MNWYQRDFETNERYVLPDLDADCESCVLPNPSNLSNFKFSHFSFLRQRKKTWHLDPTKKFHHSEAPPGIELRVRPISTKSNLSLQPPGKKGHLKIKDMEFLVLRPKGAF